MIHARNDYNRIQDPALKDPSLLSPGSTPIAEDEPVFMVRCTDKHFLRMLEIYRDLCENDIEMSEEQYEIVDGLIGEHTSLARAWYHNNPARSPTIPEN